MKHIGPILKAARERQGKSVRDMARHSGISAGTLSRLERGLIPNPGFQVIQAVSDSYRVAPALWFAKRGPHQYAPRAINDDRCMHCGYTHAEHYPPPASPLASLEVIRSSK